MDYNLIPSLEEYRIKRMKIPGAMRSVASYLEKRESEMLNIFSKDYDESIPDTSVITLYNPLDTNDYLELTYALCDDIRIAVDTDDDTVTFPLYNISGVVYEHVSANELLTRYASNYQDIACTTAFLRTLVDAIPTEKINPQNFWNLIKAKFGDVIPDKARELASNLHPNLTASSICEDFIQSSTSIVSNITFDVHEIVFSREVLYTGESAFLGALNLIVEDVVNIVQAIGDGFIKLLNGAKEAFSSIKDALAKFLNKYLPNLADDYVINSDAIGGLFDVPIYSFTFENSSQGRQQLISGLQTSGDTYGYAFGGYGHHLGSYKYNWAMVPNGMIETLAIDTLLDKVRETGLVEIPLLSGLMRIILYQNFFYIQLFVTDSYLDWNGNLSRCQIPGAANVDYPDFIKLMIHHLVSEMDNAPIGDASFFANGNSLQHTTILNDFRNLGFIDFTGYTNASNVSSGASSFGANLLNVNVDLSQAISSYQCIVLRYLIWSAMCTFKESRIAAYTGLIPVASDVSSSYNMINAVEDFENWLLNSESQNSFTPYCVSEITEPTYHVQTYNERVSEVKQVILGVMLAAAVAFVATKIIKVKKKLRFKARLSEVASFKRLDDLDSVMNNPESTRGEIMAAKSLAKKALRTEARIGILSRLLGVAETATVSTATSFTATQDRFDQIMGLIM